MREPVLWRRHSPLTTQSRLRLKPLRHKHLPVGQAIVFCGLPRRLRRLWLVPLETAQRADSRSCLQHRDSSRCFVAVRVKRPDESGRGRHQSLCFSSDNFTAKQPCRFLHRSPHGILRKRESAPSSCVGVPDFGGRRLAIAIRRKVAAGMARSRVQRTRSGASRERQHRSWRGRADDRRHVDRRFSESELRSPFRSLAYARKRFFCELNISGRRFFFAPGSRAAGAAISSDSPVSTAGTPRITKRAHTSRSSQRDGIDSDYRWPSVGFWLGSTTSRSSTSTSRAGRSVCDSEI